MNAAFDRLGPENPDWPVIFSVPHAGRDYPPEIADDCRFPVERLLPLEDRLADLLTRDVFASGFSGVVARTPRAIIDLNRDEQDMDPGMLTAPMPRQPSLSTKARGGLGLVPRRTAALGELWRRRFAPGEIGARIVQTHRPYHSHISGLMQAAHARHGCAILLDIHSMPPLPNDSVSEPPQVVIGDRFGRSASSLYSAIVGAAFEAAGIRVAYNTPYAGGHVLDRHARVHDGLHAIQIEFDRRLYLDSALSQPGDGLITMAALLHDVARQLADTMLQADLPIAAE